MSNTKNIMERVIIRATSEGYTPAQVRETMTVAELREYLDQFNDDSHVYLSFDDGYTFGGISQFDIDSEEVTDEE